ncbi:THO complex subunit 2-like isoform X2 [Lineus longissimus]|uniref:THO complex subunit 2-like isoform X2 n=1 Tax=Lineus longissimus TaxID=88925 RepID=UPI002B4FA0B3
MANLILNSEMIKSIEKGGKSDILGQCKVYLRSEDGTWNSTNGKTLKRLFYELCGSVVAGDMKVETVASVLQDVTACHKDVSSLLVDVFSLLDVEMTCLEDKEQIERFKALVSACLPFIPDVLLKERLDQETLESIGLIQSKSAFQTKYVKTKTRLYYKQQKFNLLREENEGYAKLSTELGQDFASVHLTYERILQNIKSLIGCFDLDPNRVLDIILESFECRPELGTVFIPLLKNYTTERDMLCQILGHKFHFYQMTQEHETPASLYKVAALLLHHKLIDLDILYPHLRPLDNEIIEQHKRNLLEAKAYARKFSIVILSDKANEDKTKDAEKDNKNEQHVNNQKLGLIEALLRLGDWEQVQPLLAKLPPYFATSYRPLAKALCSLLHITIEPLYQKHNGLPKAVLKARRQRNQKNGQAIRQVSSFQDLVSPVYPMVYHLGPYLSCDPILIVKLVRICRSFMKEKEDRRRGELQDVYHGLLTLIDECILPSLTMLDGNCCMSEEIWTLIKLLPYTYRYRLYGQWKNDATHTHAVLIRQRADCIEKAKYILKRLTKENVKPLGRQIGKLSHNNPGIIFEYVLSQIQKYDNFIGPVVDSLKYLTNLSYDVLIYCIIEALANPDKEKLKYDDTSVSLWLQSLANFAGAICRKYQVELAGLGQYVVNQLKAGKSYDLLILREVIQKMAGIEVTEEVTDDQLNSMSGGENLRSEGGYFAQVRNTKKSSGRLKDTLLEHDLALPLCFLMAQQRDCIIYKDGEAGKRHLKLVGKLYDQCQDTLVQFGTFLSTQMSSEDFQKKLPPIDQLVLTYHVSPDAAFFFTRPVITHAIMSKFDELRKQDKSKKEASQTAAKTQRYLEASEAVLCHVVESVRALNPPRIWEELSPQFYVSFWTLTLYDIEVPTSAYEKQINILKAQIISIDESQELASGKKKKEMERCVNLIDKLLEESKRQLEHVSRVKARLNNEKDAWFLPRGSTKNETITQFLQLCVFPRSCFSAPDAMFCAKFIHLLHELMTPNFSTLICYDRIFCDVTNTVTCCTENEAYRYGRFLCVVLGPIMKWHSDRQLYEKECATYPGFVTVFRKGTDSNNKADQLEYENYRHVCHKWHFRITKAMIGCLESGIYCQIRNAVIVLTKILPHYPRIQMFGQALERRIERLKDDEREKRPDIYALAVGYSGQLKSKRSTWVAETDFHIKDKDNTKVPAKSSQVAKVVKNGDAHEESASNEHRESRDSKERRSTNDVRVKTEKSGRASVASGERTPTSKSDRRERSPNASSSDVKQKAKTREDIKQAKERSLEDIKLLGPKVHGHGDYEERSYRDGERSRDKAGHDDRSHSREKKLERKEEKAGREDRREERAREEKGHREEKHKEEREKRVKEEKRDREDRDRHREEKSHRHEERERLREEKALIEKERWPSDRSPSVGSHSSQHQRSAEVSPGRGHLIEDRETKRRKLDAPAASTSRDIIEMEPPLQSPLMEKEREKERKAERAERKRDRMSDNDLIEAKRKKNEEITPGRSSKINGDTDGPSTSKERSRHGDKGHDREKVREKEREGKGEGEKKPKKEAKDHDTPKEERRKSDKHSSSGKKSKK